MLTVLLCGALTGCASGLAGVPLPSPSHIAGGYTITAIFANALNLPAKAKVKLNGADIGEVDAIQAHDFSARVTMRLASDAPLYAGVTAQLRSATPLGDIFVAMRPNPHQEPGAPHLREGDSISEDSTSGAATVEDVLSSMALLVNGGSVRRLVSIVNGSGLAVGGRGTKVADLITETTSLIARLNSRSAQVTGALRSTSQLAETLNARQADLDAALSAAAPATGVLAADVSPIANLTDVVARMSTQLSRFPSLRGTDSRSVTADLDRLARSLNDVAEDPALSIDAFTRLVGIVMKITNGTSAHADVDITRLAIGSRPDLNYPGDPAFHGPDGTDYHAAIGSLRYEWNVLLDKIYGPQR